MYVELWGCVKSGSPGWQHSKAKKGWMSGEGRGVCHLPRGPCVQPPALSTAVMALPAPAAVLAGNGSSSCSAHELGPCLAEGWGSLRPVCHCLLTVTCARAVVLRDSGPRSMSCPCCSLLLTCPCPHSHGSHQEEAGDCGRWCLWKDVSADRVQQGPVPRGLRAHGV